MMPAWGWVAIGAAAALIVLEILLRTFRIR